MNQWTVHSADPVICETFDSLEKACAAQGEVVSRGPLNSASRITAGGKTFYVKVYDKAGKGLRRWFGRSRAESEWSNLLFFESRSIPTAPPLAYGQQKRGPFFKRGALITEEIPDTEDLAQLAKNRDERLADPRWIAIVSEQLAAATRILHTNRFAHGDLKWRNILVTRTGPPKLYFIDCPSGAFWMRPFLQYRKNKDLACLDKIAKTVLSRTQRLRFYLDYLERKKLSAADKKELRHILRFFAGRE